MNVFYILSLLFPLAVAELPAIAIDMERLSEIGALVQKTEQRDIELKTRLQKLQQELTDAYAGFDLDERQIRSLHRKIVQTQEELLTNYHSLQFGFRRIIGPEDFDRIKKRIDNFVATAEQRQQKQQAPPLEPAPKAK